MDIWLSTMESIMAWFLRSVIIGAVVLSSPYSMAQSSNRFGVQRSGTERVNSLRSNDNRGASGGTASDFAIRSFKNGSQQPKGVIESPYVVPYNSNFR